MAPLFFLLCQGLLCDPTWINEQPIYSKGPNRSSFFFLLGRGKDLVGHISSECVLAGIAEGAPHSRPDEILNPVLEIASNSRTLGSL